MSSIDKVNHPGQELEIKYPSRNKHSDKYYFFPESKNQGLRLLNKTSQNSKANIHKRKFNEKQGKYLTSMSSENGEVGILRFLGEYEGHSEFEIQAKIENSPYWDNPYIVHKAFFSHYKMNISKILTLIFFVVTVTMLYVNSLN